MDNILNVIQACLVTNHLRVDSPFLCNFNFLNDLDDDLKNSSYTVTYTVTRLKTVDYKAGTFLFKLMKQGFNFHNIATR